MPPPGFYADNSLYRSPNNYQIVFDTGPQIRPDLIPFGYKCKSVAFSACVIDAQWKYRNCEVDCSPVCQSNPQNATCAECLTRNRDCPYNLEQDLDTCRRLYGCPGGYVCVPDAKRVDDYCCPLNTESCDAMCLPFCPPGRIRDSVTCGCKCPFQCRPPFFLDTSTCTCKCPPCLTGFLQDSANCACYCPSGTTDCFGRCVVLGVDRQNCGSCGNGCAPNEDCCLGVCVPLNQNPNCGQCGRSCGSGLTCCATAGGAKGYCSNLNADTDCGFCGRQCAKSEKCCNGVCTPINTTTDCGNCGRACQPNQHCCQGVCTLLNTVSNCGVCGKACAAGQGCCNNVCVPLNTAANCGSCGNACGSGRTCCGGICKNLQTDAQNCGMCGRACSAGKICSGGNCVCPPGQTACGTSCCSTGQTCCGGNCKNLQTDSQNCGMCGISCSGGKSCINGVCVCPPGQVDCNGICCSSGQSCCNNSCVSTSTSIQHCGGCGKQCGPTSWCEGASCVPVTISCANGTCVCPQSWTKCSDTRCCPPNHPICTGLIQQTQWGPRYLCCDAGTIGGRNYYTGAITCCRLQDILTTGSDGLKVCM